MAWESFEDYGKINTNTVVRVSGVLQRDSKIIDKNTNTYKKIYYYKVVTNYEALMSQDYDTSAAASAAQAVTEAAMNV